MNMSRREFVSGAAGLAAGVMTDATPAAAAEPRAIPAGGKTVSVASGNGLNAVARAVARITAGDDPLDGVIAGVNLVEDDPNDHSVGYGGLPNEDGVVELDSSVMHGPTHKAGAVGALQKIRNPSKVAKLVMTRTDHVLLVGAGALAFAKAHGFKEEELLTDEAREIWLKWKESHSDRDDWLAPEADIEAAQRLGERYNRPEGPDFTWGTINCLAVTGGGDVAGCTTTSGLAYKIPGRVGDSPIIGAGLYVDNAVGGAGSTGRGEANLQNCSSYQVVEFMRQGQTPEEACLNVLKRVAARCEKRLRDDAGLPRFGLKLYALRRDGVFGGASLRGEAEMAVCVEGQEARPVKIPGLFAPLQNTAD